MEQLIIIGSGPAGITAALYAVRANLSPLVITKGIGALEKAEKIENFYGSGEILSGQALYDKGVDQAKNLGIDFLEAQVLAITWDDYFTVKTTEGDFDVEAVIMATGTKRSTPPVKGLKELEGRGVSYCAVCDAFFYRGKDVAVIGNGEYAVHEAEELIHLAGSVTILTDGKEMELENEEKAALSRFRIVKEKLAAVEGEASVTGVRLENGGVIPVSGIFVAVGAAGSSDIARQIGAAVTEKGNIKTDEQMQTTLPGMFAAGDCTGGLLQVSKAVYEGTLAGMSAINYIRHLHKNAEHS